MVYQTKAYVLSLIWQGQFPFQTLDEWIMNMWLYALFQSVWKGGIGKPFLSIDTCVTCPIALTATQSRRWCFKWWSSNDFNNFVFLCRPGNDTWLHFYNCILEWQRQRITKVFPRVDTFSEMLYLHKWEASRFSIFFIALCSLYTLTPQICLNSSWLQKYLC